MRWIAYLAVCAALVVVRPVSAEVWNYGAAECNQLWYMRNLIMDRAGYCFGSPLGQALFDNGDCRGQDVVLSAEQKAQVAKIRGLESQIGCAVNTGARSLDVAYSDALGRLRDMALPDNGAARCTWAGAPVALYDGYTAGAQVIGAMEPGDAITFEWIGDGGASLYTISKGGYAGPTFLGWLRDGTVNFEGSCTDWVG